MKFFLFIFTNHHRLRSSLSYVKTINDYRLVYGEDIKLIGRFLRSIFSPKGQSSHSLIILSKFYLLSLCLWGLSIILYPLKF